jgi:hypothetical protein
MHVKPTTVFSKIQFQSLNILDVSFVSPLVCLIYLTSGLCVITLAPAGLRATLEDVYKTIWPRYLVSVQ